MTRTYLAPGPENLAAFAALDYDEPINMLNFLRYREIAEYPQGHENAGKGWSGREAYEEYGRSIAGPIARVGARIVWRGAFQATIIGSAEEAWDDMLIVHYPSARAFVAMTTDPEYLAGAINRTAALSDSRLFRTRPEIS